MGSLEIFLIAVGLSMDAVAVSIAKGLSLSKIKFQHACLAGIYFGGFQALMPLIGYFLGSHFREAIESYDHWIAFAMLVFIGINMIRESFGKEEKISSDFSLIPMLALALATSIDALVVGISFAILQAKILSSILIIGITTFVLSAMGVSLGSKLGSHSKKNAERLGGAILILLGTKILLEHTFVL